MDKFYEVLTMYLTKLDRERGRAVEVWAGFSISFKVLLRIRIRTLICCDMENRELASDLNIIGEIELSAATVLRKFCLYYFHIEADQKQISLIPIVSRNCHIFCFYYPVAMTHNNCISSFFFVLYFQFQQ